MLIKFPSYSFNYEVGIKSSVFQLRSRNNEVPTTQFISTPDSSGKPLSEARSLERIAGKGLNLSSTNAFGECFANVLCTRA
jgi:hypothetical protein